MKFRPIVFVYLKQVKENSDYKEVPSVYILKTDGTSL